MWPYTGIYTAELSIVGEWWGEWCVGIFNFEVDSDAEVSGTGVCESSDLDASIGVEVFASVAGDGEVSGVATLYLHGSAPYDFEVSGSHSNEASGIFFEFLTSGYQEQEVRIVRE